MEEEKSYKIENVSIRTFDPEQDTASAYRCYRDGFSHVNWPIFEHASINLTLDMLRSYHEMASDALVAEVSGEVNAFLLGSVITGLRDFHVSPLFSVVRVTLGVLSNSYQMNRLAYKHLLQTLYGYLPFSYLHPFSWTYAEVMLFTSTTDYRNQGIGRKLMDAFVSSVKERGIRLVYVGTDTAISIRGMVLLELGSSI